MFSFSSSRLSLKMIVSLFVSNAQLGILPFHSLFVIRSLSSRVSSNLNDHSFTVSFLINSCGLTLKSAQSVSKRICFKTLERPDLVLRLLREHGFTNSHISKIVKFRPNVLLLHPERTILPKLEFLCSIGVSRSDLSVIVSQNPDLLNRSIKQNLIPHYHILKMLSQIDFFANLSLLRGLGIPQSSISSLVIHYPLVVCLKAFNFAEGVKKNIMCSMNFLVCKMGWQPAAVARVPVVLSYGLETRIKPRCSVVRVLLLKSLIEANVPVSSVLIPTEEHFLERFVTKYQDQLPQLLDIFQGKMGLTELGFGFDGKSVILD
ncbi:hypothetical protein P3X46_000368 [Hevea brasiliensis]|uniref:Uncharacterized protein n=1 Tax=Hevea brasiliensis TaxID=3981 RepID=A0ABQ9N9S1_HEVBR|nr:hypothetical protein P3X46_000368 [Hevea brasiliensis]